MREEAAAGEGQSRTRVARRQRVLWYLREQNFMCFYCMEPIDEKTFTQDHIIPRCRGGTLLDGMVLSCHRCNVTKQEMPFSQFIALIDADKIPILRKNRRGFGQNYNNKRGSRQQIEITRLWQIRRALSKSGKIWLMIGHEELNYRWSQHCQNAMASYGEEE